jgi:hypothetical protein
MLCVVVAWCGEASLAESSLEAAGCAALAPAFQGLTALQKLKYVRGWLWFAVRCDCEAMCGGQRPCAVCMGVWLRQVSV